MDTDFTQNENGECYRIFKNASGKPLGKILKGTPVENPKTGEIIHWYTVDFNHGIGEFTISEQDDITNERLKAIAEYKRCCIQQELNRLSNEETRLRVRLDEIDELVSGMEEI